MMKFYFDKFSPQQVAKVEDSKMYLSGDFIINGKKIYLKEVIYSEPATIAFWSDNTKTVSKCTEGDIYSRETGLALCILKKTIGATKVHDILEDWVSADLNRVTLKDVRKNHK